MRGGEEFRRNWPVLVAAFVGIFTGVISFPMYLIGPFLGFYHADFGWSATAISLCSTCMGVGLFLTSPLTGAIIDRFGARKPALISLPLMALCFFALSYLNSSIFMLYGLYFAIGVLGSGTGNVSYGRAVSGWFEKQRGFALGLTMAGTGLASATAPLLVHWFASDLGWRMAWRAMALLIALGWPIIFWGLKEPPHDDADLRRAEAAGAAASDIDGVTLGEAVRDPRFYVIALTILAFSLFLPQLIIHFLPSMIERGLSAGAASNLTAFLGVAMIAGRIGSGWVLDRVFAPYVAFAMFALAAAGCAAFAVFGASAALTMILGMGLVIGAEIDLMSFLVAKYFGLRQFGRISGLVFSIYTGAALFSPLVATPLRAIGGYPAMYLGAAAAYLIGACAFLLLGPYRTEQAAPAMS
jgi:MFS family permease